MTCGLKILRSRLSGCEFLAVTAVYTGVVSEIYVMSDPSVWGAACRRVTTSDALMVNALTSLFGGIWLEIDEQATSPKPKQTIKPLMKNQKFYDFLERTAVLDEEHVAAVVFAIFR